ncbi:MAG: Gfo/Idh/MocA family protein [Candidatus Binatales bacterium]
MRLAISGAGAIAERAHIPAFVQTPGVEIVAMQSRTAAKAEAVARNLAASGNLAAPHIYTDFDQMLAREHPDAVGIFTPNRFHCEFTLKAIASGCHVLVEKPMAPAAADARQMVAAADAAGRILMVAMQRRHAGLEKIVKEALDAGAIGVPNFIRARLSHGGPEQWAPGQSWFYSREQAGGGAMLDLGVHVADLAIWMMGEIDSVIGQVGSVRANIEVEDHGAMVVEFRSGATGVIEASWNSRPGLASFEIYGSEGRVMCGYPRLDIAIQRADGSPAPGYSREEILKRFDPLDFAAPSRALAAAFVAAIRGERAPCPSGADGMRAVEAIEACYRSSRTGSRITLPLEG